MSLEFKVTLVIPILNEASSLLELLESIRAQTLLPDEVIFCDAGSTDSSPEIIREWWNLKSWSSTSLEIILLPGAMPGAGRNAGIRSAKNNWIAFLDGGIIPQVDWLRNLCIFAKNTGAQAVFGLCNFSGHTPFSRAVCALSYGEGSSHPVIPASLFSRCVFEKVGYFQEQLRAGEDILWLRHFLAHYKTRHICFEAQVSYIQFPNNWLKAARKWRMYEYHCVKAGVRGVQQYLYLLAMPLVLFSVFEEGAYGWGLLLAYLVLRGIIDPIRRSKSKPWWGSSLRAALIAPLLVLLLDTSKWCGIVQGMTSKFFKKIGDVK